MATRKADLTNCPVIHAYKFQLHQQNVGQTECQMLWPPAQLDLQVPPPCDRQFGTQDSRFIHHYLQEVHTAQTGCYKKMKLEQHQQYIYLGQPEKSLVAEHSFNREHCNQLNDTNIISIQASYMDQIIKEVMQIDLHPNRNKDDGLIFSMT